MTNSSMTALNKQALREAAQEEIMLRSVSDTSDAWQDEASPEAVLALLDELEAAEKRIAELLSENAGLNNSVENAAGCINAAYAEGLIDVLSESNDDRLVDLVKRRLLFAYLPVETSAINEELIAMGDWVMREQLEDGTRAIKTLNRRIAELEARELAVKQFDDFQIVHYGGSEDYAKGYIDCQNNYNKALTAAGIGVKGE